MSGHDHRPELMGVTLVGVIIGHLNTLDVVSRIAASWVAILSGIILISYTIHKWKSNK